MDGESIRLPFYEGWIEFEVPVAWNITVVSPPDLPVLGDSNLLASFEKPIGSLPLRQIARGRKSAAVIVEDVTRPMRIDRLVPIVLRELESAGIAGENIVIVSAVGCHKAQTGPDFRRKLGNDVVDRYRTLSPSLYDQLTCLGKTSRGTPVHVSSAVADADVKVGVGGILPHSSAGFGGGGKTALPGVCGFETISEHHLKTLKSGGELGIVDGNAFREDLEEAARILGLDFIVNAVIGTSRDIAGLFAGDMIEAHRAGVEFARHAYGVRAKGNADLAIISAYPEDFDLIQSTKALCPGMGPSSVKEDGTVILISACPDGVGYHSLYGPTGPGHGGFKQRRIEQIGSRELVVCSPGIGPKEMLDVFPPEVKLYKRIEQAIDDIARRYPAAEVNVFPFGAVSLILRD